MSGYDPRQHQQPATPPQWAQPGWQHDPARPEQSPYPQEHYEQRGQVQQYAPQPPQRHAAPPSGLTAAGSFWYVLQCVAMGAGYFAKIPAKKALQDFGMVRMTSAEQFWYVLMCIGFGAGYFAKLPIVKALSEMPQNR